MIETLLYGRVTWSPNKLDYEQATAGSPLHAPGYTSADENGSATITPSRTLTRLPKQIPRAWR